MSKDFENLKFSSFSFIFLDIFSAGEGRGRHERKIRRRTFNSGLSHKPRLKGRL
jgi:hypothetical protein